MRTEVFELDDVELSDAYAITITVLFSSNIRILFLFFSLKNYEFDTIRTKNNIFGSVALFFVE